MEFHQAIEHSLERLYPILVKSAIRARSLAYGIQWVCIGVLEWGNHITSLSLKDRDASPVPLLVLRICPHAMTNVWLRTSLHETQGPMVRTSLPYTGCACAYAYTHTLAHVISSTSPTLDPRQQLQPTPLACPLGSKYRKYLGSAPTLEAPLRIRARRPLRDGTAALSL